MTSDRQGSNKKTNSINKRKRSTKVRTSTTTTGTSNSIFDTVSALEQEDEEEIHLHSRRSNGRHSDGNDNTASLTLQRQKAAVQAQTNIYSRLIECRILLQRSMTTSRSAMIETEQQPADGSIMDADKVDAAASAADAAIEQCNHILIKLLDARKLLTPQSKDTEDDHDCHSDAVHVIDYTSVIDQTLPNKKSDDIDAFDELLQQEYEQCRSRWKEVLNRRHYDIQLHSGAITNNKKFNLIDTSFWHQVQSTIQHQQLRHINKSSSATTTATNDNDTKYDCYQPFDDTKIYQQMLKDFVEAATNSNNKDTTIVADMIRKRHKIQHQSSSSSSKPMVDRKASKGRKIRYTAITKLANFTFPIQRRVNDAAVTNTAATATFLDEDAWFRSLFGGT